MARRKPQNTNDDSFRKANGFANIVLPNGTQLRVTVALYEGKNPDHDFLLSGIGKELRGVTLQINSAEAEAKDYGVEFS